MTKRSPRQIQPRPENAPRLVGYRELREWFGWPKSTLVDWVREEKFPRGMTLPGGRTVWVLTDVEEYIERCRKGIAASASSDPSKLKPEPVEDIVARAMSKQLGAPVNPEDVIYGAAHQISPEEAESMMAAQAEGLWHALEDRFSLLDRAESLQVIYGLFPGMRPFLEQQLAGTGRSFSQDGIAPIDHALAVLWRRPAAAR